MNTSTKRRRVAALLFALLSVAALALLVWYNAGSQARTPVVSGPEAEQYDHANYIMNTFVTQTVYGEEAQAAALAVNEALIAFEQRLSLFGAGSDIANINAAAGDPAGAEVSPDTARLIEQALALSAQSEGAFAITIAPVTLAWGVTGDTPRVPANEELEALLPLVDDGLVQVQENRVALALPGMALDLGGIAKGAACGIARDIYARHKVTGALLDIGGNIYTYGDRPNGEWLIGFRDPGRPQGSYVASFLLQDEVIAVSGGYERFFEDDSGKRYIHIFNPATGRPVESDIVSVGALHTDGATADFWSTTLYVWGLQRTLDYMRAGGRAIVLDEAGTLYVSASLQDSFALYEAGSHPVVFVGQAEAVLSATAA